MTAADRQQLAERARDMADQAWLDRRAWLTISVAIATTASHAAARKALDEIRGDDVRDRAAELLGQLLAQEGTT